MVTQRRRQFLAGLGSAMIAADGAYDPTFEPPLSEAGYVVPDSVSLIAGNGPTVPVWLHNDRVTVNRFSSYDSERQNDRGIAVLSYLPRAGDSEPPTPLWDTWTPHTTQHHRFFRLCPPDVMRVVDARTGQIVFTSALPEPILRPARAEVEHRPLVYDKKAQIRCGPRGVFSRLFSWTHVAPYEEYFERRPLAFLRAVSYRRYLRLFTEDAALIQVLNPDFLQWFWRRAGNIPEPPEPEELCGEAGEQWSFLADTYV